MCSKDDSINLDELFGGDYTDDDMNTTVLVAATILCTRPSSQNWIEVF